MAATKYPFTIEVDFPNAKVNIPRLAYEIRISSIVTSLDYISTDSGICDVWFKDELSSADINTLYGDVSPADPESIIGSHSGEPLVEAAPTTLYNSDDSVVNFPMTSNRTPIYNPNILPPGYMLYITGAFDDLTTPKRGEGDLFGIQITDAGTDSIEGQFFEHVYALGGSLCEKNADYGDWANMEVYAPASAPTSSPGVGNANKVPTGLGFNIIVPAPLMDGDWTIDGSTLSVGEINENLVPVPNSDDTGYWNWNPDNSPSITPVGNPASPDGTYDLYDAALPLVRQANRIPLMNTHGECCPDTIKGKKLLPHWKLKFTINRASAGTVSAMFYMKLARKSTT